MRNTKPNTPPILGCVDGLLKAAVLVCCVFVYVAIYPLLFLSMLHWAKIYRTVPWFIAWSNALLSAKHPMLHWAETLDHVVFLTSLILAQNSHKPVCNRKLTQFITSHRENSVLSISMQLHTMFCLSCPIRSFGHTVETMILTCDVQKWWNKKSTSIDSWLPHIHV